MDKKFNPEKYQMMVCPVSDGQGRIGTLDDDVKVCKNCGGFGFIRKERKAYDRKDKPISTTIP